MIIKSLVLTSLLSFQAPTKPPSFPLALGNSKIAKGSVFVNRYLNSVMKRIPSLATTPVPLNALVKSEVPNGLQSSGAKSINPQDPATRVRVNELFNKLGREVDACQAIADSGDRATAEQRLERNLMSTPQEIFGRPLLNMYVEDGEYVNAYKVAAALIKGGEMTRCGCSEDILLLASLASAELGEVYPGQREFVVKVILRGGSDEIESYLPKGETPAVLACLSQFAIGAAWASHGYYTKGLPYLDAAYRFDPENPELGEVLANCLFSCCKYSEDISVLKRILARAGKGTIIITLTLMLREAQYLLAKVGDGKPSHPEKPQTSNQPQLPKP